MGQTIGVCGLPRVSVFYRRRLPHWIPDHAILFLTWRLAGSPPPELPAVVMPDVHSERFDVDPVWLSDSRVAGMMVEALRYGEEVRDLYQLYVWVIMPNHVHVILCPHIPLPEITRWLKGRTARRANQMLGRIGQTFWQDESFDRWIRSTEELGKLMAYVESNPVTAGLVERVEDWPWSSARLRADDENRSSAPRVSAR